MSCYPLEQKAQVKDIVFVQGDDLPTITMTVIGVDLTDYEITWAIGDIFGTVDITDAPNGMVNLSLTSAETLTIDNGTPFVVSWVDDSGFTRTIWIGKMRFLAVE